MTIIGVFPKWHSSTEEGNISSICGCWRKRFNTVPGLLTVGNVGKVRGRLFQAERTTSSEAPAWKSAQCVGKWHLIWGGEKQGWDQDDPTFLQGKFYLSDWPIFFFCPPLFFLLLLLLLLLFYNYYYLFLSVSLFSLNIQNRSYTRTRRREHILG